MNTWACDLNENMQTIDLSFNYGPALAGAIYGLTVYRRIRAVIRIKDADDQLDAVGGLTIVL